MSYAKYEIITFLINSINFWLNTKIEGARTSYIMKTSTFEKYYNVIADLNNETAEKRQKMKEIIEKNENEISPHSFNSKLSLISILVSEDLIKPL